MENEYREREEQKPNTEKYSTENPMDAVRNRRPNIESAVKSEVKEKRSLFGRKKSAAAERITPTANQYKEKSEEPEFTSGTTKGADKNPSGGVTGKKLKKDGPAKRPNLFVQVLNGDILTRDFVLNNLTFIFFLLFLLLLMVSKGYYGKQLAKDIDAEDTDVRAKTAEYIENKARLEESTARYRLVEALEKRGLKETVNPAKVIRLKTEENE